MRDINNQNFGLLIAYVLPGFIAVWGLSHVSTTVQSWLGANADGPSIGGFLYVTLASVGAGLTMSTLRWLLIDTLHHRTGVRPPEWDFRLLSTRREAFDVLVESHYRYYQAYSNSLLSIWLAALFRWPVESTGWKEVVAVLVLTALFYLGSRDCLSKYYRRAEAMLASPTSCDDES
ncbi:MAG: hypothetical protein R3C18_13945 [Planctomycetaceae bacterium]